ncbi:MAG: glutamine synthetase III [Oscillospiraceae bacterium]
MGDTTCFHRFGERCFDDRIMREKLPREVYNSIRRIRDEGKPWDPQVADVVAGAMREWAMEKGATHYVHWFTPMTGASAGKHDSFIDGIQDGEPIVHFSGKMLTKGEPDASSFPSGGLRTTFEARGYTSWDPTSPCFVLGTTLYIPTAFCAYNGEALDQKTPVLRSMQAISQQSVRVLRALGDEQTVSVTPTAGAEQEYFLVDKTQFDQRLDLKICGRTLEGARPPKGQEMEDHYYGSVPERVRNFMRELDNELWCIGVPAKTEHNEVAPGQYELASVFASANVALDHNQIIMELLRKVALRHGFACILHEKPFAGVNGSGKHNNWSLITNTGKNLLSAGDSPVENAEFLVFLCAAIAAVDKNADILRMSTASASNDLRLGANEAPPAIISIFLGDPLTRLIQSLSDGLAYEMGHHAPLKTGVSSLPHLTMDDNDRNRTSPFAFTGNRFEFRMVGSSQSIGLSTTVLCAAVADVLSGFADKLEKAENIEATVAEIVHDTWVSHSHIIFNGNNYSAEWYAEAERRGLPNISNTVDAAEAFVDEKNLALFERTGVFSRSECHSRYEITLEAYTKTVKIEMDTLLQLVGRSFLPSACRWLDQMSSTRAAADNNGTPCRYATAQAAALTTAIDETADKAEALRAELTAITEDLPVRETARKMRHILVGSMEQLRTCCETLEGLMPETCWPVPDYATLLYEL